MQTNYKNNSGRLSMRTSILVWTAGIMLGWGIAVVTAYVLIRNHEPASQVSEGSDAKARELNAIAPAAGGKTNSTGTAKPQ
jgi:hypothetical protein